MFLCHYLQLLQNKCKRKPLFNPFLVIKNKWLFISSEGFYALEKRYKKDMFQRAMLPIQSGVPAF
jgi:hypothetical protein